MTTISILSGDFEILFDDETVGGNAVAGMRMVRRQSGAGATVYTSLQLYSAVADEADAFEAMGFTNPMLPTTPNAFTMENQYFIPRSSTEFLREGTLTCDWTNIALPDTNGNGVIRKPYTDSTPFVTGDIGRQVTESASTDTGTLLDFEKEPDGTFVLWIRPDVSGAGGDEFDATTGTISVTGDAGTGSGAPITGESDGITKYTAIQAIGSVPTASEVYVVQDRIKLGTAADETAFQFWATDPTLALGIISVLIRTRTMDVDIADEDLEVFARRYTSLYDNFRLNVAAGGFSALPLASAPDINNTTGYFAGAWDAGTGSPMVVGDIQDNTFGGKTGGSYVVTAVTDGGATGTFEWYEVGDLTAFADNDTFTGPTRNGTIQGTPTANVGGPTEAGAGNGGTVTIVLGQALADHDGNATNESYSVTIDAQGPGGNGVAVADVYERIKYVTRRGQDNTFWDTTSCSIPGEQYHGIEAQIFYDAPSGTFTEGDDITGSAGYTARVLGVETTGSGYQDVLQTYITVTDQQTSLDGVANNQTLTDTTGGDTVVVDTDPNPIASFPSSNKASPFGTFTGTQLFGSRGILYVGQHDDDTQSYTLIDDGGFQRTSPNTVTFTVANTLALDRVLVARDTGVDGIIDKDQFGGMSVTAASATSITVGGTVDAEVPTVGFLRVVAVDEQQEHKYHYSSRTTGASGIFTLDAVDPGTANDTGSVTTPTNLNDSTATFQADGVVPGMLIQDTTNGDTYEVVNLVGSFEETRINIIQIFGTGGTLATGDLYTINETIQAYDTNDDLYDLILDVEATSGTTSNTFVQSTTFDTVVNVRQGKIILPFTQNAEVTASGGSVTVVRQPDTIAS